MRRYTVPQLGPNTVPIWMSTGTVDPIMKVGLQEAIVASVAAVRINPKPHTLRVFVKHTQLAMCRLTAGIPASRNWKLIMPTVRLTCSLRCCCQAQPLRTVGRA